MGVIVKELSETNGTTCNYEAPVLRYGENIIKRNRIVYSIPQLVRLGLLPASALDEYNAKKNSTISSEDTNENTSATTETHHNHTFWENDDSDRKLLSRKEYEQFLAEHSLNI